MKILATTLGETLGDFFAQTLDLGYLAGIGITLVFFLITLYFQLSAKRYIPDFFWLVIIGTTTLGTEISDFIDRSLHLGYALGSFVLVFFLLLTLYLWHKKYGNLEVSPIFEKQKEIYFWVAVLFSNSLGTAFGDYLNDGLGFSYLIGALITLSVIVVVVLLHSYTKINNSFILDRFCFHSSVWCDFRRFFDETTCERWSGFRNIKCFNCFYRNYDRFNYNRS